MTANDLQNPQPAPTHSSNSVAVWPDCMATYGDLYPLLVPHMQARHEFGVAKYGTALMTDNGRDPLIDALQEALDLIAYLHQHQAESGFGPTGEGCLRSALQLADTLVDMIEGLPGDCEHEEVDRSTCDHARRELQLAGYTMTDGKFNDYVAGDAMKLIELFVSQQNEGSERARVRRLLNDLLLGKILTPLTGADDEWEPPDTNGIRRNKRCPGVELRPDGTAWDWNGIAWQTPNGVTYCDDDSYKQVAFPYWPTTETRQEPPEKNDPEVSTMMAGLGKILGRYP